MSRRIKSGCSSSARQTASTPSEDLADDLQCPTALNKEEMSSPMTAGDDLVLGGNPPDLGCGENRFRGRFAQGLLRN